MWEGFLAYQSLPSDKMDDLPYPVTKQVMCLTLLHLELFLKRCSTSLVDDDLQNVAADVDRRRRHYQNSIRNLEDLKN